MPNSFVYNNVIMYNNVSQFNISENKITSITSIISFFEKWLICDIFLLYIYINLY